MNGGNPGRKNSTVGNATSIQLQATDSVGKPLTHTATGLSAGLDISPGGLISGTPGASTVTVTVSGTATFSWGTRPLQRSPHPHPRAKYSKRQPRHHPRHSAHHLRVQRRRQPELAPRPESHGTHTDLGATMRRGCEKPPVAGRLAHQSCRPSLTSTPAGLPTVVAAPRSGRVMSRGGKRSGSSADRYATGCRGRCGTSGSEASVSSPLEASATPPEAVEPTQEAAVGHQTVDDRVAGVAVAALA